MGITGSKIGYNNNISTTSLQILSNADVTDPIGEQAEVVSTSINDTSSGTGLQKIKIKYFNTSYQLKEEIVTLSGTTRVLTSAMDILLIESFESFQTGTTLGGADGTIKLRSTDTTRLFAQIDPGENQFLRSLHFVTPGYIGNMQDIIISTQTSGGVKFVLFVERDNTSNGGNIVFISNISFTSTADIMQMSLYMPVRCDATQSSQPLRMGIATIGLVASQSALANFSFYED